MTKLSILLFSIIVLAITQLLLTVGLFINFKRRKMIKTIAIDLDGVLNTYCGNYNENEIAPPKEGVHEFLAKLAENYKIEIFTVRNTKLTAKWLIDNDLDRYVSNITNVKNPFASAFIDDRAIRFNGDYDETLNEITGFKPYWR